MTATRSGRWQRIERLFNAAADLPAEQQKQFLEENCRDDDSLLHYVAELLSADGDSDESWPGLSLSYAVDSPPEIPGYQDLKLLGRGGMGKVYLARRYDRLFEGRACAIKVLHAHRTHSIGRQRFEVERQLLAKLEHPNIVSLFDGGELADGRPYLVMDYVEGLPIDQYCRRQKLPLEERLRLFQEVCGALNYAHQNLIIHRDIKPSNILVDAQGSPHLLDFGIAKRLDRAAGSAPLTIGRPAPMTLAYASPEQISGEQLTTANDLYSLGLVLYEVLTGLGPEDRQQTANEYLEHPLPSSLSAADAERMAPAFQTTARRLRSRLRGDLDHIVAKTLRRQAPARYASVRELAEDIGRHLEHLPVLARRGNWRYSIGRLLRRHRLRVALVTSALLVAAFVGAITLQSLRLARAEASNVEKSRILRFLTGPDLDPLLDQDRLDRLVSEVFELSLDERQTTLVFDAARRQYLPESQLADQILTLLDNLEDHLPRTHAGLARVSLTLGDIWSNGDGDRAFAEQLLARSLAFAKSAYGEKALELVPHFRSHALALGDLGRFDDGIHELGLARRLQLVHSAPRIDQAQILLSLNNIYYLQGAFSRAAAACRSALTLLDQDSNGESSLAAEVMTSLAVALIELPDGQMSNAMSYGRRALQIHELIHGKAHMRTLNSRNNLAVVLGKSGRSDEAFRLSKENLKHGEATLGIENPKLAYTLTALATYHHQVGDFSTCTVYARRAVALREAHLPKGDWLIGLSKKRLGSCLDDLGERAEAIHQLSASLEIFKNSTIESSSHVETTRARLANLTGQSAPTPAP